MRIQKNGFNFLCRFNLTNGNVVFLKRHAYDKYMKRKNQRNKHENNDEKNNSGQKKAPILNHRKECGLCQRLFKSQPSLDHHYRQIHKISAVDGHALK